MPQSGIPQCLLISSLYARYDYQAYHIRDRYDYQCFEADGIEVQKYLLKLSPFVNRQKVSTKIPP
jgi:hypothetical protein